MSPTIRIVQNANQNKKVKLFILPVRVIVGIDANILVGPVVIGFFSWL